MEKPGGIFIANGADNDDVRNLPLIVFVDNSFKCSAFFNLLSCASAAAVIGATAATDSSSVIDVIEEVEESDVESLLGLVSAAVDGFDSSVGLAMIDERRDGEDEEGDEEVARRLGVFDGDEFEGFSPPFFPFILGDADGDRDGEAELLLLL